jgi:DNA/RNA-binding domain of Phe-tRNA-synthetase-like protein
MKSKIIHEFYIQPEIANIGLKGVYMTIENILNKETDEDFEKYRRKIVQQALTDSKNIADIKEDLFFQGFRKLHEAVDAPNRKNLSAPENLYKLLTKNGDIPRINLLVDIYNTVSVKSKLALGAHDLAYVTGNIHLRFTDGTEKFIPLGESEPKNIAPGEYSYIDDNNDVICYLDVRQVNKTKVTLDTKDVFLIVQGNANTPFNHIEETASELICLIIKYCGGKAIALGQIGSH